MWPVCFAFESWRVLRRLHQVYVWEFGVGRRSRFGAPWCRQRGFFSVVRICGSRVPAETVMVDT